MRRRIAYYAHDHGSGHVRHARNWALCDDFDLLVLSSSPDVEQLSCQTVRLTSDRVDGYVVDTSKPFHYTPTTANVRARFTELQRSLDSFEPDVVVVDVSAEVAAFAKLCGYRTIVRRMPGVRNDHAHLDMYAMADGIVAYYTEPFEDDSFDEAFQARTTYAGMPVDALPVDAVDLPLNKRVVVLTSLGGDGVEASGVVAAARQTSDWHWAVVGRIHGVPEDVANLKVTGVTEDVPAELKQASVIISSGGHNAIRDAVLATKPLIVLPEPRPYAEQQTFAKALAANSSAVVIDNWAQDWPLLLEQQLQRGAGNLASRLLVTQSQFQHSLRTIVESVCGPEVKQ